jgi:hypothetical protein
MSAAQHDTAAAAAAAAADSTARVKALRFRNSDGHSLAGLLTLSPHTTQRCVILCHGQCVTWLVRSWCVVGGVAACAHSTLCC